MIQINPGGHCRCYHLVHCGNHRQLGSACRAARVFSGRSFHELHLHDDDLPSCPGPLSSLCAGLCAQPSRETGSRPKWLALSWLSCSSGSLHAMGQVSDVVSLVLFDFACSGAADWRIASEQDRFRELMPMCCSRSPSVDYN